MPNMQPLTKEQMLAEFWDDLGLNPYEPPKKKVTKKDLVPMTWEVREKLRQMVCEHEQKIEAAINSSKYPLLVKGEVDPSLKNKTTRKKRRREEQEHRDKDFVDRAQDRLKGLQNDKDEPWKSVSKDVQNLYKATRHSYHQKVAPTRFFQKKT